MMMMPAQTMIEPHNPLNLDPQSVGRVPAVESPLARYYGGKSRRMGKIIAQMIDRIPHHIYLEPFGGMASVLLKKQPSAVEIYNDLDDGIVDLMQVVAEPRTRTMLLDMLHFTPYSRKLWRRCYQEWPEEKDQIRRAWMVYVVLNQNFVGQTRDGSWSFGGPNYNGNVATRFYNAIENIELVAARLRTVAIECFDVFKLLERWDCANAVWYLDPPYVPSSRKELANNYRHEFRVEQHERLLGTIAASKAAIIISGYPSEMYSQALSTERGWVLKQYKARASSMMQSAGNKRKGKACGMAETERIECLWLNPRAAQYQNQNLAPRVEGQQLGLGL